MKFTFSVAAALGLSTFANAQLESPNDWRCSTEPGAGADALLTAWDHFNKLFGTEALVAPTQHSFYAICDGLVFGYKNNRGVEVTEDLPLRSDAANSDPGNGSFCSWGTDISLWENYVFSYESDISICEENCGVISNDVRRC